MQRFKLWQIYSVRSTLNNRPSGPHNGSGRFGGENSVSPAEKRSIYQHFNVSRVPAIFLSYL